MDNKNFRTIGLILLFFFIVPNNTEESHQGLKDESQLVDTDNLFDAMVLIYNKWKELCVLGKQDLEPETVAEASQALPGDDSSASFVFEKLSKNQKLWKDLCLIKNESDPELIQRILKDILEKSEDNYEGKEEKLTQLRGWDSSHQESERNKRWKEMAVWGKRDFYPEMGKRWKEMGVWGKRDSNPEVEKKWKEMSVWGKRSYDPEVYKKWKEMAVWGKRNYDPEVDKKWKEMAVWGKRNYNPEVDKKWKEMAVWGKRNYNPEVDKKWKEMAVWGKRNYNPEVDKRWKEMAVWGKRGYNPEMDNRGIVEPAWETRDFTHAMTKRWKELAVWGKRSSDAESQQTWRQRRSLDNEKRQSILKRLVKRNSENLGLGDIHPRSRRSGSENNQVEASHQQASVYES